MRLNRIRKLRLALDHIDVVMGFLSAGGEVNPNNSLNEYAATILKIQDFNNVVSLLVVSLWKNAEKQHLL